MKIIHLCQYYSEKLGYQEPNLVISQRHRKHKVYIITSDRNFPFPNYGTSYLKLLGPRLIGVSSKKGIIRLKPLLEFSSSSTLLLPSPLKHLKEISPDIVIVHEMLNPNIIWGLIYKYFNPNSRLILDSHLAEYNTHFDTIIKKLYLFLWRLIIKPFLKSLSNKIIATGENEKIYTQKYLLDKSFKVSIVPLGANSQKFNPISDKQKTVIRREFGLKPSDLVIINAGKINPSKKILELVESFHHFSKYNKNIKLVLVGGGDPDYLHKINNFIQTNNLSKIVTHLDFVDNSKLASLLSMSDIGVWPGSKSNVFVEAMACGLPLILEEQAYAHAFTNNNNGFNISTKKDLKIALSKLIKNTELRKKMGTNSRQLFLDHFSWDKISLQYQ